MYQISLFIWPGEFLWLGFYNDLHFLGLRVVFSLESWLQRFSCFLSATIQHILEVLGQHFSSIHSIYYPEQGAPGKDKQLAEQLLPVILVGCVCLLSALEPWSLRRCWLCLNVSKVGRGPGFKKESRPATFLLLFPLHLFTMYVSLLRDT